MNYKKWFLTVIIVILTLGSTLLGNTQDQVTVCMIAPYGLGESIQLRSATQAIDRLTREGYPLELLIDVATEPGIERYYAAVENCVATGSGIIIVLEATDVTLDLAERYYDFGVYFIGVSQFAENGPDNYFAIPYMNLVGLSIYNLIPNMIEGNFELFPGGGIYEAEDLWMYQTIVDLEINGLTEALTVDLNDPDKNCGLSPFVVGGQWHISGAAGFVQHRPSGFAGDMAERTGEEISNSETQGNIPVGILVVDDFDGNDVSSLVSDPNRVGHGYLVLNHLERLSQGNVSIGIVDTGNYKSTGVIAASIGQGILDFEASGISRIVVNMSFAVVPCVVARDFTNSGIETFEAYAKAIWEANPHLYNDLGIFEDALMAILNRPLEIINDPLSDYIQESCSESSFSQDRLSVRCSSNSRVIALVASAGNFGFSYSFYPGAFEEVISVEAQVYPTGARWYYSNRGEVAEFGGWYEFNDGSGSVSYIGTSFAAPAHSYRLALQLSR